MPESATHLISLDELDRGDLEQLLDLTDRFVEVSKRQMRSVAALRGRAVVSLFFDDAPAVRLVFETAAKRLGADVVTFDAAGSADARRSLRDTVEAVSALGVDAIVVRHRSSGVAQLIRRWTDASVLNAGDGWHQDPTQALLDAFTIRGAFGSLDGLRVAIVGDVQRSGAARSAVRAFTTLGAEVVLVAPPTLLPSSLDGWPVTVSHDLDVVLGSIDVCCLLPTDPDWVGDGRVPSLGEYDRRYGLDASRSGRLRVGAIVLRSGRVNRCAEVTAGAAGRPNAIVARAVPGAVAVRQAVLFRLLGSGSQLDAFGASSFRGGAPDSIDPTPEGISPT